MKIGKVRWTPFLICAPIAIIYYIIYRFNVIRITVFPWDIGIFIFNIGIILLIDRLLVIWLNAALIKILFVLEVIAILYLIIVDWKPFLLWQF